MAKFYYGGTVFKGGGTTLGTVKSALGFIETLDMERRKDPTQPPILVVSALSKVTDELGYIADAIEAGDKTAANALIQANLERHLEMLEGITYRRYYQETASYVEREFGQLTQLSAGEMSPQVRDRILVVGELASSRMLAAAVSSCDIRAQWLDAREIVITDNQHGSAAPNMLLTHARAQKILLPLLSRGIMPVMGGFIGATVDRVSTTLGRNRSDYSAVIAGVHTGADEVVKCTDVDGICLKDPREIQEEGENRIFDRMSYDEAIAHVIATGGKVIHPDAIRLAKEYRIKVRVRNARHKPHEPKYCGTLIAA